MKLLCAIVLTAITVIAGVAIMGTTAQGHAAGERGELIYVPIYSSIYYDNSRHTLEMAATLAVHNVNVDRTLTVTRADYYNTGGKLIKHYLEAPLVLKPLETKSLVIEKADTTGGTGANFLVEWRDASESSSPVVEAIMINAASNLGIAFTSPGRVIQQFGAAP
ncbi:MAG TPA: DUF3124 domain-containing protein [Pirellulales bacterium]|jgi:hypothetical protein|nr:DUF3124 domain-containing protein [Pirellulales bacterium]